MSSLPRLDELFGAPVDQLTAEDLRRAIAGRVAEDEQLDFKGGVYESGKGADIASDVAAFANHLGGVIILGITEDPRGIAGELTPFSTAADAVEGQVRQACNARIRPFVNGLQVVAVETGNDQRCVVIIVPRGRNAPYARVQEKPDGTTLEFPVRDGSTTRWLHEQELGSWYRDRFASRGDLVAQAAALHATGLEQLDHDSQAAWITVSCVPSTAGSRGRGVQARSKEASFLERWLSHGLPAQWFGSAYRGRSHAARARTVFSDRAVRSAPSRSVHLELLHNGGGFAAQVVSAERWEQVNFSGEYTRSAINWLATDRIEWAVFTCLRFLADHAIDTGAGGELEVVAQLELRGNHCGLCVPLSGTPNSSGYTHFVPELELEGSSTTSTVVTVPLTSEPDRSIAAAAFELTSDIFAEFGVDEPRLFTDEGWPVRDVALHLGPALITGGAMGWLEARRESQTPPSA